MLAPIFTTGAEIVTFEDLVVLKFYYGEPKSLPESYFGHKLPYLPAATIIMPRPVAKQVSKRMVGFLANQEEHIRMSVCRHCVKLSTKECAFTLETPIDAENDGCSKFERKEEEDASSKKR